MLTHSLPPLPYAFDALEPYIDALTMEIHHDRHHQTYITNYTKLLDGTGLLEKYSPLELAKHLDEVPEDKRQGVKNNLGGHLNHSFFWEILSPNLTGEKRVPIGEVAENIDRTFGSFGSFQEQFTQAALSVFGSGWAWLVRDADGTILIQKTLGQDAPFFSGQTPIIGIDVWEHAYYLKHQNKRADYIAAFWNVVKWEEVGRKYQFAM